MSKQKKIQRRADPVLWAAAATVVNIHNRTFYGLKRKGVVPKGPGIVISNHTSNHDHEFIGASVCYPHRVAFLGAYHWFTFKKLGFWLKRIGAIPKLQYTTDILSMKKLKYAVQKNRDLAFIAPEGTVYASGRLGYIDPAIAKLIRFLGVNVYATRIQGAGLGNTKWNTKTHRTKVTTETQLLIKAEETKTLKPDEIMERINKALAYDEFAYQAANNVKVKGDRRAEGFETMFYKCPVCGSEFTLSSENNTIRCSHCGAEAEINESFRFDWKNGVKSFDNYMQWYDWQFDDLKKQILAGGFRLSEEVEYGTDKPGVDNYVKVGKGTLTLDDSGWNYKGTFDGQDVEEHDDLSQVFLATLKTGRHFELPYRFEHCRVFYTTANPLHSMKWHLASRAYTELLVEGKIGNTVAE